MKKFLTGFLLVGIFIISFFFASQARAFDLSNMAAPFVAPDGNTYSDIVVGNMNGTYYVGFFQSSSITELHYNDGCYSNGWIRIVTNSVVPQFYCSDSSLINCDSWPSSNGFGAVPFTFSSYDVSSFVTANHHIDVNNIILPFTVDGYLFNSYFVISDWSAANHDNVLAPGVWFFSPDAVMVTPSPWGYTNGWTDADLSFAVNLNQGNVVYYSLAGDYVSLSGNSSGGYMALQNVVSSFSINNVTSFPPLHQLTVTVASPAGGTVTGAGINCNSALGALSDCTETFPFNQSEQLTYSTNSGYEFLYWDDGSMQYAVNPFVFTMSGSKNVTAKFVQVMSVNVTLDSNMGSVVSSELPSLFIHCDDQIGSVCTKTYRWDDSVTLTANYKPGYKFTSWKENDQIISTDRSYCFLVESARNLTAVFEPFKLGSPFHAIGGQDKTPYTAEITAILDHSLGAGNYYGEKDQKIVAYNGAVADKSESCFQTDTGCLYGYQTAESKADPQNYLILPELNYIGGGDINAYGDSKSYLWYDDHSGYDYSMVSNTPLYATAGGKLYKATSNPVVGNETWNNFHAIYIDHGNGYFSWYLHCNSIDSILQQQIDEMGYADVIKDQFIASSGNYPNFGYHMHFELQYKDANGQFHMIDPYELRMWDASPQ